MKRATISRRPNRPVRPPGRPERVPETAVIDDDVPRENLPLSGKRILVVDDNPGIATLLAGQLQDAGATVDVCRSADASVAQAIRRVPALAIIHLPLPKDGAAALSQRLRQHAALPGIRVIILSGEEGLNTEAADAADAVHPRPISPQRLLEDVTRLLQAG